MALFACSLVLHCVLFWSSYLILWFSNIFYCSMWAQGSTMVGEIITVAMITRRLLLEESEKVCCLLLFLLFWVELLTISAWICFLDPSRLQLHAILYCSISKYFYLCEVNKLVLSHKFRFMIMIFWWRRLHSLRMKTRSKLMYHLLLKVLLQGWAYTRIQILWVKFHCIINLYFYGTSQSLSLGKEAWYMSNHLQHDLGSSFYELFFSLEAPVIFRYFKKQSHIKKSFSTIPLFQTLASYYKLSERTKLVFHSV